MATAGRAGGAAAGIDWRCWPGRGCCAGTTGGAYEEAAGAAAGGAAPIGCMCLVYGPTCRAYATAASTAVPKVPRWTFLWPLSQLLASKRPRRLSLTPLYPVTLFELTCSRRPSAPSCQLRVEYSFQQRVLLCQE